LAVAKVGEKGEGRNITADEYMVSFWGDENDELDSGLTF
jgi:hypothetical protein